MLLIGAASHAGDQEGDHLRTIEHWRCYSRFDFDQERILVEALRGELLEQRIPELPSASLGEVRVAGMSYQALFHVDGFDRTWTFGPAEELVADTTPHFIFLINPDGSGFYYDLSGVEKGESTRPTQTYECVDSRPHESAGGGNGYGTGTRSGAEQTCSQRPEVMSYLERVRQRTLSRWTDKGAGEVEVEFVLDAAGSASAVRFVSAPNEELGASVTDAMRVASPFEPMSDLVRQCLAGDTVYVTFSLPPE